ncbi:hypothetical protein PIB30_069367 [Stylosanthes scabra]|uniref:Uncharacterized protein n=1 Tax=Stylosanthes scabra TaxID=79078 RepID=A0ABU6SPG3_9FABA|nr:hypothetical protein [Stylosanthes scabra]
MSIEPKPTLSTNCRVNAKNRKSQRSNAEESRINVLVFYLARGREDGDRTGRGRQRDDRSGRQQHRKEKRRETTAKTLLAFKEQRRRRDAAPRCDEGDESTLRRQGRRFRVQASGVQIWD